MKEKYRRILRDLRDEEKFDVFDKKEELAYLDSEEYIDAFVINSESRDARVNLSDGDLVHAVENNQDQYDFKFENIELKQEANRILLNEEFEEEKNKIYVSSALVAGTISFLGIIANYLI